MVRRGQQAMPGVPAPRVLGRELVVMQEARRELDAIDHATGLADLPGWRPLAWPQSGAKWIPCPPEMELVQR